MKKADFPFRILLILLATSGVAFISLSPSSPASGGQPIGVARASQSADQAGSAVLTPTLEPSGDVILFDFEDPEETGRFVYGNINTFAEPTAEAARTGTHSCVATFYTGADRGNRRCLFYTLMHPARGRIEDWRPYSEFQAAILNAESFTVTLDVEYADGTNSVWRRYGLPPGVWCRLRQPLAELESEGLNLGSVKRVTWSQLASEMQDINSLYFDDIRLIASDPAGSRAAVRAAWTAFEEWTAAEGARVRAGYLPTILRNADRIGEIERRYECGHLDGYVVTEVCVVGGGMAGTSASIASGRLGVETLLVEQYGFLGGMATAGMVGPFMPNRAKGQDLVKGVFYDIVGALQRRGAAERDSHGVISFDKEALKDVLNELVIEAGCRLMLHSWAERPLVKDKVCEGIIVDNKSGRLAILAQVVIDSTGDGDMAAGAGCPYEIGRGYDQYTQSTTLLFRMGNVNTGVALAEQARRTSRPGGTVPEDYLFADLFRAAVAEGRFPSDIPVRTIYFERTINDGEVSINATRAFEVDATDVIDLTYASVETRRQAVALADFLVENVPGFQNAYLQETGVQVGVRESRRILGEYQLTGKDVLHGVRFPDVIARGAYGIDIHCADYSGCGVTGLTLDEGASYDIPYRCLVPLEVDNLLLAGRCISVSHIALGSVRIMPVCSGTGHAAGVAAAVSVIRGVPPRDIYYPDLRDTLLAQKAVLD